MLSTSVNYAVMNDWMNEQSVVHRELACTHRPTSTRDHTCRTSSALTPTRVIAESRDSSQSEWAVLGSFGFSETVPGEVVGRQVNEYIKTPRR